MDPGGGVGWGWSGACVTAGPRTEVAISRTASNSPSLEMGKPASITSTPSRSSCRAISSFSSTFIEAPGDCSPSLSVVSKM